MRNEVAMRESFFFYIGRYRAVCRCSYHIINRKKIYIRVWISLSVTQYVIDSLDPEGMWHNPYFLTFFL